MKINIQDSQREEKYLKKVQEIARKSIADIDLNIDKEKQEILELKKYIWNDCKSLSDLEYGNLLNDTDAKVKRTNDQIKQVWKYERIIDNSYFGRINFKTSDDETEVYIGLYGMNKELKNYVFDWRAPISSLFYNYDIGKAKYDSPSGSIDGDITLRRQYKIENGEIKRIIENDMNINDEILQDVLASNSSDKMRNIVTTIQREQNVVIRNESDRYLIVQGVAGSGKTSVALHRIAYLLYRDKDLTHNNVLIFSPNEVFSDYISEVLPELGEENVLNTTFIDIAKSYLTKYKKIESYSSFLERIYDSSVEDKKEPNFCSINEKEEIDDFLDKYLNEILFSNNIKIGDIDFNKFELNQLLTSKYKKFPFIERISKMSEHLCLTAGLPVSKNETKVKKILLDNLSVELDAKKLYNLYLKNKKCDIQDKKIQYDKLEGILYMYFEINGYPYNTDIKHIIVDEVQDYSLLQLYMLKKIFPYASFTILGDINQTINPYCKYKSLNDINIVFNNKAKYIELLQTYRSTEEIITFSNNILGIKGVKSIRKNSDMPVIFRDNSNILNNIINDLNEMKTKNIERIAIITKNNEEAEYLYDKLKDKININFITSNYDKNDVLILPSYMSKGLEFDGVIAYINPENQYDETNRNLFYVVSTRAQHQLIVYNQKQLINEKVKTLK